MPSRAPSFERIVESPLREARREVELEASKVGCSVSRDWLQSRRKVERHAVSIESSFEHQELTSEGLVERQARNLERQALSVS